jgi:hypothetical protein
LLTFGAYFDEEERRLWTWLPMTCMFFGTNPSRDLLRAVGSTLSNLRKGVEMYQRRPETYHHPFALDIVLNS